MKKLLLTLGAIASITTPLATVIACGQTKAPETDGVGEDDGSFTENLQIDGEDFVPEDDGVYLMSKYYNGDLMEENRVYTGEILEVLPSINQSNLDIGKGDSIVVVYNGDDTDGFVPWNFEDTFGFTDVLVFDSEEIVDYNVETFDNKVRDNGGWRHSLISTFAEGKLNKYIGSSNTIDGQTTAESMAALKPLVSQKEFDTILSGLQLVEQSDGTYADVDGFDPDANPITIRRDSGVFVPETLFEYERIAKNAIKVTYIPEDDAFTQTHASFGFYTESEDVEGEYIIDLKGELYIGENAWAKNDNGWFAVGKRSVL